MLAKNKLVSSTKGITGGFIIQKDPDLIDLQEIYCAVEDRKAFHLDVNRTKGESAAETAKFNDYFFHLFADVQVEIEDKMKKISLGEVMKNMGVKSTYFKRGN